MIDWAFKKKNTEDTRKNSGGEPYGVWNRFSFYFCAVDASVDTPRLVPLFISTLFYIFGKKKKQIFFVRCLGCGIATTQSPNRRAGPSFFFFFFFPIFSFAILQ